MSKRYIVLCDRELWQLAAALSSLAAAAGELDYVDHYSRDFPTAVLSMPKLTESTSLRNYGRAPPNLFQWLENLLRGKGSTVNTEHLPSLLTREYTSCVDWSRKVIGFYEILTGGQLLNGQLPSGVHIRIATGNSSPIVVVLFIFLCAQCFKCGPPNQVMFLREVFRVLVERQSSQSIFRWGV